MSRGGGGYSGINVTGGGGATEPNILHPKKYMDLILCTQINTRLELLDPKKYMTFIPKNAILKTVYILPFFLSDLAGTLA